MVRKSRATRRGTALPSLPSISDDLEGERRPDIVHFEVALAVLLWGVAYPLLVLLAPERLLTLLSILLFVVLAGLTLHALSLRPFCVERVESPADDDLPLDQDKETREDREEIKLMFTSLVLLTGVGAILCLALGGDAAFHSWFAAGTNSCSVGDLAALQQAGYAKFSCQDGFVDVGKEASILTKGGGFRGAMRVYRIAPMYVDSTGGLPVAWSITRDHTLSTAPCSQSGLCGLFLPSLENACVTSLVCFTPDERDRFAKLQGVYTKALQATGASGFDGASLPFVILTDPSDPLGKLQHLLWGMVLWAFTLMGLLWILIDILVKDVCPRSKAAYDPLMPYQTVSFQEEAGTNHKGKGSLISAEGTSASRGKEDLSVTFAREK